MSDPEKRVFEALHALEVPDGVNERTLAAIEALRDEKEAQPAKKGAQEPRKKRPRTAFRKAAVAIAACLCLAFAGVGGYAYATPTAYVDVEAEPRIQLSVNRFNIVVDASALNTEGEQLLASNQVVGKNYDEALSALDATLPPEDDSGGTEFVTVSIACDDSSQARTLQNQTEQCLEKQRGGFACTALSTAEHDEAHHAGMGVARYAMAKRLVELGGANSIEDCQNMSMRELRALVDELDGAEDSSDELANGSGDYSGSQAGNGRHHGAHHNNS